jgi:hypothetical protein
LGSHTTWIDTAFKRVDANRLTAVIDRNGKAVSRCKIMLGGILGRGISYSANDRADDNGWNDSLAVETDAQGIFLNPIMGMSISAVAARRSSSPSTGPQNIIGMP